MAKHTQTRLHTREASNARTSRSTRPPTAAQLVADWEDGAAAWARYEPTILHSLSAVDASLLRALAPAPGHRVLDVGCGLGEPALTIARWVGPRGHVTGLDVSRSMLAAARRRARTHGVRNVRFVRGAVERLSDARAYDRVASRYGIMFTPDVDEALARVARALRRGGRFASAVWGPPDRNAYFQLSVSVSRHYVDPPPVDPAVPGPMRFADPAPLARALRRAGLTRVRVEGVHAPMVYPSLDVLVEALPLISSSLRRVTPGMSGPERARLAARIRRAAAPYVDGTLVRFPGFAWVVSAERPR